MSIHDKLQAVAAAETDCVVRTATARAAWRGLTSRLRRSATAPRVVVSGLVVGFVSGLRSAPSTPGMADRLVSTLLESVLASIVAGLTVGTAAAAVDTNNPPKQSASTAANQGN